MNNANTQDLRKEGLHLHGDNYNHHNCHHPSDNHGGYGGGGGLVGGGVGCVSVRTSSSTVSSILRFLSSAAKEKAESATTDSYA